MASRALPAAIKIKTVNRKQPDGTTKQVEVYWFRVDVGRDAAGKRQQVYKSSESQKEIKAEYARIVNETNNKTFVRPRKLTLSQYLDEWIEGHCRDLEKATKRNYQDALRPVHERLGQRPLQSIEKRDVEQLVTWMTTSGRKKGGEAGTGLGPRSVQLTLTRLSAALAMAAGRARGVLSESDETKLVRALIEVPRHMSEALALEPQIEQLARALSKCPAVLYLGRGTSFPLALEGALKLKEISYIHAEGYAAGELKHGPIALIDEKMPVIVIAPHDQVFEKTASNMQEVAARGGRLILLTDRRGAEAAADGHALTTLTLPTTLATVAPLVYAVPVQLIAYHTAVILGTDVDQPRNLAKSVTVE